MALRSLSRATKPSRRARAMSSCCTADSSRGGSSVSNSGYSASMAEYSIA